MFEWIILNKRTRAGMIRRRDSARPCRRGVSRIFSREGPNSFWVEQHSRILHYCHVFAYFSPNSFVERRNFSNSGWAMAPGYAPL